MQLIGLLTIKIMLFKEIYSIGISRVIFSHLTESIDTRHDFGSLNW